MLQQLDGTAADAYKEYTTEGSSLPSVFTVCSYNVAKVIPFGMVY